MGNEWKTLPLSDVADINPEQRGRDWPHNEIKYIDISSVGTGIFNEAPSLIPLTIAPSRAQRIVRDKDTILSTVRPNRRSFIFLRNPTASTLASTGFAVLRAKPGIEPRFLYYIIAQQEFTNHLDANTHGSAYPAVSPEIIGGTRINLPSFETQCAIADILGSLDDKIELNRRTNETLEAMARAVFKSWFVDFDPVHAKSKGRQPDGMDAETASLFPSSFQDSEIGRVPKGWKMKAVSEVADINAWTLGKNDKLDPIQYVEISKVNRGDIGNIQAFEWGQEPSRARRRLRHGDTVLSTVRPDHRSYFLCLHPVANLIASTGFAVLSPTKVPWSFLHAGLTQSDVFDNLGQHADGGAYPAVRPEVIGQWRMPLPDDAAILDAFHGVCAGLFEKAENNRRQAGLLSHIRDSLLPGLLSGNLNVSESTVEHGVLK